MSSMLNFRNVFTEAEKDAEATTEKRTIYVVDDDMGVRRSLHFMLSSQSMSVWPFVSAMDFIDQLPLLIPAPVLLDIRMANIDGLQLLEILREQGLSWPVIILTAHGDVRVAVRAMKLGAIEFLEKPFAPELLDHAINQAFAVLEQTELLMSERDRARQRIAQLTAREAETMAILMEGLLNKEVAHRLNLSVRTVEMHRANALIKLRVKSIAEVVSLANVGGFTPDMRMRLKDRGDN
jgi:two-component system response regulator FixJ